MSRRFIIGGILAALVALAIFSLMREQQSIRERLEKTVQQSTRTPDIELSGATFKEIRRGITYWELRAGESKIHENTGAASLVETRGTFFENGNPTLRFIAPQAIWRRKEGAIRLKDMVGYTISMEKEARKKKAKFPASFHLSSASSPQEGAWFHAQDLYWSIQKRKLECEGGVRVHKGNIEIEADKLVSDVGLRVVELQGSPRGWIGKTEIRASQIDLHRVSHTLDAKGPISILRDRAKLIADSLHFDEVAQGGRVKGNVRFELDNISAHSEEAEYNLPKQVITFTGQPNAVQGENRISGDKIIISIKDRRVSVAGKGKATIQEENLPDASRR